MKTFIYLILLTIGIAILSSCKNQTSVQTNTLKSPDGSIEVNVWLTESKMPVYEIKKDSVPVLEKSKLGLMRKDADFTKDLSLISISEVIEVNDSYQLKVGKKLNIDYKAYLRVYQFENKDGIKMDIIFQVSNDGVAFRYYFPDKSGDTKYIDKEFTSFKFPTTAKAWLQHCAEAKSGWSRCNPSYEENYEMEIPVGTPAPFDAGWVYPALFKSGENWVLISETGLTNGYCATRLAKESPNGEYFISFPQKEEICFNGELNPQSTTPWYSPWRILAIGSLKTVTESTLGTDLAAPAIEGDFSWVKPGRASWSWVILKDDFTTFPYQKKFIDYAADMGWEYCLVDGYWDTKIGYDKLKELGAYASSKNVGLLLWYNSAGDWNETPITPRDLMLTHESRMNEFKKIKEMGFKGIKVDFWGGDGQSVIQYYQELLKDAARAGITVNCHGSTLPRGWQRTYPNLVNMEAIKGMEFITFEQANADIAPAHCAMLPFTRNVFDPMDFTPVCFSEIPNIVRRSTNGFELALSVLFVAGIQHYAEIPEGIAKVPEYVKETMKNVPVVWDESVFVDGYPGKYVVMARRSGTKWYVAGINGEAAVKELTLDLTFLKGLKGNIITDGETTRSFNQLEIVVPEDGKYTLKMKVNGGFLIQFN